MSALRPAYFVALMLILSCGLHAIAAQPPGARDEIILAPGSPTPAAALQRLEQAMKAGDLEACAAAMATPVGPVMRQSFEAIKRVGQAKRKLAAALAARFGGDASQDPFPYAEDDAKLRASNQQLAGMTIVEQKQSGEQVTLIVTTTVRAPEGLKQIKQGFTAVPQNGTWKIVPISHVRNLPAQRGRVASAQKVARAFEALAENVAKFPSRQEAERAARQAYDIAWNINQPPQPGQEACERAKKLYLAKNFEAAFALFLESARAGYVPGQVQTAWQYYYGLGVAENEAEAARWNRRAAEQGDPSAQNSLGLQYLDGEGVPRNPAEALKWISRSAAQDYANGLFNLGRLYEFGDGVPENRAQAIALYRRAAALGHAQAVFFANHLKSPLNRSFRNGAEQAEFLRIMNIRHRAALADADSIQARREGDHFESARRAEDAARLNAAADRLQRESKFQP